MLGARHARRQGRSDAVPAVPPPPSPLSALTRVKVSGAPQSPPCHRAFARAIASASGVLTSNSPRSWFLTIRSLHTKVTCSERPSLRTGYHPQILTSLCTLFSLYSFLLLYILSFLMAGLGLGCFAPAFSSCDEHGYSSLLCDLISWSFLVTQW